MKLDLRTIKPTLTVIPESGVTVTLQKLLRKEG